MSKIIDLTQPLSAFDREYLESRGLTADLELNAAHVATSPSLEAAPASAPAPVEPTPALIEPTPAPAPEPGDGGPDFGVDPSLLEPEPTPAVPPVV